MSPHLSIGATGQASLAYARSWGRSSSGGKSGSWQLGGTTAIAFAASIYF